MQGMTNYHNGPKNGEENGKVGRRRRTTMEKTYGRTEKSMAEMTDEEDGKDE